MTGALQAMLIRVLSMTPEQINMLAPAERASIMQLVRIYLSKSLPHLTRSLPEGQPCVNIGPTRTLMAKQPLTPKTVYSTTR